MKITGASLTPIIEALASAALIDRIQDPLRDNRPTYHPADPLVRFRYALIRRHQSRLSRHDADTSAIWSQIVPTFDSQVVGPCFESAARYWVTHFASRSTIGGGPDHVGPATVALAGGEEKEVGVVVAADDGATPSERTVLAVGEAKAGERMTYRHLQRLCDVKAALGERAAGAKVLLFGVELTQELRAAAEARGDVELIDLERLYHGR